MRSQLVTYLSANMPTGFKVSQELPWSQSGQTLYNKNLKTIYLDREQHELVDLIPLINADAIQNRIDRVRGYLTVDAKNQPSNIDSVITAIRAATNSATGLGDYHARTIDLTVDYIGDQITYSWEYVFTKLN